MSRMVGRWIAQVVCCLAWLVAAGPSMASTSQWQYEDTVIGSCASVVQVGNAPEEVAQSWIGYAKACNGDPSEWYELLGCAYLPVTRADAASAICYMQTHVYWGVVNWQMPIVKWCPGGTMFGDETHDCECPSGQAWNAVLGICLVAQSVPRPSNPPSCPADPKEGNPIFPLRGVKQEVVDTGLSVGRLTLRFTYDSTPKLPRVPAELAGDFGAERRGGVLGGPLWSSNLDRRIALGTRSASASTLPVVAAVTRDNARSTSFVQGSGGQLSGEVGTADRLVQLPDGSLRYDDAGENRQEVFNAQGRITSMTWADGTRVTFTYSDTGTPRSVAPTSGLLLGASDNRGRSLSFGYVSPVPGYPAQVGSITDAAGRVTTLAYDARNNLASITWPDGAVRTLVYDDPALPWALTGIRDEKSTRYASFGYDAAGRAVSTEHAGGTLRYSVSYGTPPSIQVTEQRDASGAVRFYDWNLPQGVVVTRPNGSTSVLSAASLNGKNYLTGQSQEAGAGCAASASGQGFDANGNLASRDDFNGTRSCYVSDLTRNLQITEVTGLSQSQVCGVVTATNAALPGEARKTSTQWHPDWSLQTKQAAPGQITTNVYNGQPDPFAGNATASCAPSSATLPDGKPIAVLCKQVEQATTDGDGHLGFSASLQAGPPIRVRTWTYNERGQVLTAKGTRGNVNDTENRSYYADTAADHTVGDLATITDARGKVTTFNRYNKLGQVLQSTDANGAVTLNTYDLRQRLLTSSVNGRTTAYEYDPIGQLKKVTQPDGSWIGFDYDDAHRQVAAYDNRGNRIDYVLDNSGQRTATSAKDPNGALKTNLARVMDALGRLQRGNGEE